MPGRSEVGLAGITPCRTKPCTVWRSSTIASHLVPQYGTQDETRQPQTTLLLPLNFSSSALPHALNCGTRYVVNLPWSFLKKDASFFHLSRSWSQRKQTCYIILSWGLRVGHMIQSTHFSEHLYCDSVSKRNIAVVTTDKATPWFTRYSLKHIYGWFYAPCISKLAN